MCLANSGLRVYNLGQITSYSKFLFVIVEEDSDLFGKGEPLLGKA